MFINAVTPSRYHGDVRQSARNELERRVKAAELEGMAWHSLRHTFASRLMMVDLRTVQELLGHRTIQMTCRYARLAPQHTLSAAGRLARFSQLDSVPTGTSGLDGQEGQAGDAVQPPAIQ